MTPESNSAKAEERLAEARRWLARARKDHEAYQRLVGRSFALQEGAPPKDPALAIYLLQQANEKALKGLAIASGKYSHQDLEKFSHDSMALYADFLDKLLDTCVGHVIFCLANKARESVGIEPWSNIDEVRRQLKSRSQWFRAFREWPAEPVEKFARALLNWQTCTAVAFVSTFVKTLQQYIPETNQTGEEQALRSVLNSTWAFTALLFLSALTFPHEASTRYPSPQSTGKDKPLDCESYSDTQLGIVRHLHSVGKLTQLMLINFDPLLEMISDFFERSNHFNTAGPKTTLESQSQ